MARRYPQHIKERVSADNGGTPPFSPLAEQTPDALHKFKRWLVEANTPVILLAVLLTLFLLAVIAVAVAGSFGMYPNAVKAASAVFSPVAIILGAGIAGVVAMRSIENQRKVASRNLTVSLLAEQMWDADYIKARARFISVRDSKRGLIGPGLDYESSPETAGSIRDILNDYELMAIGVKYGIVDMSIYRDWHRSTVVADYKAAKPLIDQIQETRGQRLYVEFEGLALVWQAEMEEETASADQIAS